MSFNPDIYGIHAAARVDADAVPANVTFQVNNGFTTVVRNGAGDYTLTPQNPFDINRMICIATLDEADARGSVSTRFVGVSSLNVVILDNANAAKDQDFTVLVIKIRAP